MTAMNKMLEALKRLQNDAATACERPAAAGTHIVRRVKPGEPAIPGRKFDVSSWQVSAPAVSLARTSAERVPPTSPRAEVSTPAPAPVVVQRFESPWERSARHDLANPLHARDYQTVLLRWQEDLPGTQPRAVMIAGIGCGPTEVAEFSLRLAIQQAKEGASTLLVDGESSRWLSNALVAHDQPGLTESFAEGIPPRHFFQTTFTPGLNFLPSGAHLPDLQRNNAAAARFVNDLKTQALWTIIAAADAGTTFAVDLARACDAVYLLVRIGAATNQEALRIRQELQGAGARLLGCIALEDAAV